MLATNLVGGIGVFGGWANMHSAVLVPAMDITNILGV